MANQLFLYGTKMRIQFARPCKVAQRKIFTKLHKGDGINLEHKTSENNFKTSDKNANEIKTVKGNESKCCFCFKSMKWVKEKNCKVFNYAWTLCEIL